MRVEAVCQGISPLLMNPMDEATLDSLITGVRLPKAKDRPFEEMAAEKIYRDDDGNIGIPAVNLFSCLVEAGRRVKLGKSQISTKESTILPSFLAIEEFFLPFTGDPVWVVDKRRGVSNSGTTKVAVGLVRPKFEEWAFKATLEVDTTIANEGTIRQLFKMAGSGVGLCDFRPACKGPFGRFKVASWVELSEAAEQDAAASQNGKGDPALVAA